ncbi:MAG: hypothetical protein CVU53_04360 [Deltaproteobacteria bacterium HGW-Deltaproteobacteria-11]|nr:MAG: hypothetical protein CVU53_04360 [Deltaproteobacteria bacterium HGW-Deltaproteobacteria-11]
MAQIDPSVIKKASTALRVVSRLASVDGAYLFGSQVEGMSDPWSDIDLAVFVEDFEKWNLRDWVRASVEVQKEAGDDVEVHFFPATALRERDPAGFAAWILTHGVDMRVVANCALSS